MFNKALGLLKAALRELVEIGLLLIATLLLVFLFLGKSAGGFATSVVENVGTLAEALSPNGLVALLAVGVFMLVFDRFRRGQ